MTMIQVDTKGFRELDRKLRELPNAVAGDALRVSLLDGLNVIRDDARVRAPREEGVLAANIVSTIKRRRTRTGMEGSVRTRAKAWYGRLVEFGTAAHTIIAKTKRALADKAEGKFFGRVVRHPGAQAKPFLRPAFDAKAAEAVRVMGARLWAEIVKFARGP